MKENKKVSIIVPVYNNEKYIDKCLNSLINQSLKDIEIIIVNDGSTDDSAKIIKKYVDNYPKIIKYIEISNSGVANARNIGLENATGDYIGFCDSDDYVELNMFELLWKKATNTNAEIVVSGYYSEKDNGHLSNNALDNMSEYSKSLEENPEILLISNPFITSKIFSKKLLEDNNIKFNKNYRIFEDLLFTYSSFLKANKIEKVNKPLYHYIRRINESVTGSLNYKFYDLFPVMEELKEFYHSNSTANFDSYLTYIAINHAYLRFTSKIKFKQIILKYRYIRDCYKFLNKFDENWKNNIYFTLKKREKKVYKTISFWFLFPILKKIKLYFSKLYKKTIGNYGHQFIKSYNKPILNTDILFESQKGNDINGNMFYLIKQLRSNKKYDTYNINICVNKNRINEFKNKLDLYNINNYNLVINNSKNYIKHLARDKYLFTDTSFPTYFKKRKEQIYLNTWHGTPLKYLGRNVAYEYYDISNVMKNFLIADYILYPNNYMKEIMVNDYMLDIRKNNIIMLGYPRNSIFFQKTKKNKKQKIAYLPTWRGTKSSIGGKNYLEELTKILKDIDIKLNDNQEMYINLHPYMKGKLDINFFERIKLFPNEYETYDFLNTCDILITDYSSVFFDFSNTGKKIILFTYDKESYIKDRGMYIDIDTLPFKKAITVNELIQEINEKDNINYHSFLKEYAPYDSIDTPKKILSLILDNNYNKLNIISNKEKNNCVLIESNSYLEYDKTKELYNYIIDYKNNKKLYLGFLNSKIAKNKEYLNKFDRSISYFGYFGSFEYTSMFDSILLKLLKRNKKIYNIFYKKFNSLFSNELERRYDYITFSDVLLYKESNVLNIYLYSYIESNKIIILDNIPEIDFKILDRYDKIILTDEKDIDYLSKYIDKNKIYSIDKFNFNKFL